MGAKCRIKIVEAASFFLISVISLCFSQDVKVYIEPVTEVLNKPAAVSLAVTCIGEAEKSDLFQDMKWIGPKGEISKDDTQSVHVTPADSNGKLFLFFSNPTPEASGRYNCSAKYDNTITREDSVLITFYHAITWHDCSEQQAVVVGKEGRISCMVKANPPATVQWYRGGSIIEQGKILIQNDGITIPEVTEKDSGDYKVRAMVVSTGDLKWRKINVEVHVPPKITELNDRHLFVVGERAEIYCKAEGHPTPKFYWFHKGQNLSTVEGYLVNTDYGVLTIQSVKQEDKGDFTCKAANSADIDEKNTDVVVIIKPEVVQFNNMTVVLGKHVTMECKISGDPSPKITIRKDGNEQPFNSGNDRIQIDRREEDGHEVLIFTITNVQRGDDGLYYCAGENEGGRVERVGHLQVEFAPDMSETRSTDRKTWRENSVNLTCIAEAIPNATITWTFRNSPVYSNELYHVFGDASYSNLLVKPSNDIPGGNDVYGAYRCEARNQFGNSSIVINLQEAREPGMLLQASIERHTATTITFMLRGPKDDGGLPVQEFIGEYWEKENAPTAAMTTVWVEGNSYILEKLKPRTAYIFRFAAKNAVGIGQWTQDIGFVMPIESTPEIPTFWTPAGNVSRHSDSFLVRWGVPQDNGKPIDNFQLRYFEVEWEGNEWRQVGKDRTIEIKEWESKPRYSIPHLKPNTQYKVEIRAHNSIGYSQPASMIFRTSAGSVIEEQKKIDEDGNHLTTAAIVAIIIVVVLVILGLLDATCYLRYNCGVFFCLRTAVCGRSSMEKVKDGTVDDGPKGQRHLRAKFAEGDTIACTTEETPMMAGTGGAKDKLGENNDFKNKSPKGSKSSIAKDSSV